MSKQPYVIWFEKLGIQDVPSVGGKNASLGEMIAKLAHLGVRVPGGFATTAQAFRDFLAHNDLEQRIGQVLDALDVADVDALSQAGKQIRQWVMQATLQSALEQEIRAAWQTRRLVCRAAGDLFECGRHRCRIETSACGVRLAV
jgi:pyruvate,water dikinase